MSKPVKPNTPRTLYSHNHAKDLALLKKAKTLLMVAKANCMICQGHSPKAVKECVGVECPWYDFRMGKNPHAKPRGNPQKGTENLKKHREKKKQALKHSSPESAMSASEAIVANTDKAYAPDE